MPYGSLADVAQAAFSFLLPGLSSVVRSFTAVCGNGIISTPQPVIALVASFCLLHTHESLQCLLFSIIQPHIRNYIAVLSLSLLFVTSRVHWQQLLPVALGTGNFQETTKSQLMLLWGVIKTGSIKPYSIFPFLTAH